MKTRWISTQSCVLAAIGCLMWVLGITIPAAAQQKAVVITSAADYSSGAHNVVDVDPVGGPRGYTNDLVPTVSDLTLAVQGRYFYRIERFFADNIAKFDIADPATPLWQYSTMDANDSVASSNPRDLVFAGNDKAYLLRQNTPIAWIVNPKAENQAAFKTGTLDLSAYSDGDNYGPEMTQGIVVDGKLFILMQRMNQDKNWEPQEAYVAVFEIATDTEIDTGQGQGGLKGILLPIKNPSRISYLAANDTIYIQGAGRLEATWSGTPAEYSGGIVSLDPETYQTQVVVDDGDDVSHPYGNISGLILVNETKSYFVGYQGWGNNSLYSFNPTNGTVYGTPVSALNNISIPGMEAGGSVDENGLVWVTDATNAQIVIIDPTDDTVDETVPTNLNPQKVGFVLSISPDGDVAPLGSRDGMVNVADALVTLRFALGLETATQEDLLHCDVAPLHVDEQPDPDGEITVADALIVLRMALGLVSF